LPTISFPTAAYTSLSLSLGAVVPEDSYHLRLKLGVGLSGEGAYVVAGVEDEGGVEPVQAPDGLLDHRNVVMGVGD